MELNKYIDHTLLKPEATKEQITKLCEEARQYDFASVCVNTCYVPLAKQLLAGSDVKVCCVVGFPLGAMDTVSKAFEAKTAVENGAQEVDMVINIGALKDKDYDYVTKDIAAVVEASKPAIVKVIIEACLLTDEEKVEACKCSMNAKAEFVKTSTGFSTHGATPEDVALMKKTVGDVCKVKAAGGVRSYDDAMKMIEAGADRLGCSAGIKVMEEAKAR
ncbi:MAG: deoxyribose-phosphate aldolase [Solobacterium sp.]|nr:deoxyribose-phosphate aldolase [Solobacterium sp.]MDY2952156.1 deoxyribose-phosphate aldolase [Erysipelotrichaceae bacterium]MCI6695949.1 deoxyribose-phosphate aldolase [Solobacterium sp.]MCI6846496.1 deoxyribose-phosphate aldolase [Solobacterium sp.]MCI6877913.1 deoxyribose-phosphate aldolase [Solobacterium sp.]